jgi:hypothetical protein
MLLPAGFPATRLMTGSSRKFARIRRRKKHAHDLGPGDMNDMKQQP